MSLTLSMGDQEITHYLWNPKLHYQVHKSLLLNPVPSQLNPLQNVTSFLFEICFNTNLPFTARFPKWLLLLRISDWNSLCISHLPHACHIFCPPHYVRVFVVILILLSLLSPNNLISILFSYILNLSKDKNSNLLANSKFWIGDRITSRSDKVLWCLCSCSFF